MNSAKAKWNSWADAILADRAALHGSQQWFEVAPHPWSETWRMHKNEGENEQTRKWFELALVDFSGHVFDDAADFSGFKFPGEANFGPAEIAKGDDQQVAFKRYTCFDEAVFLGAAQFGHAEFQQRTYFRNCRFVGDARFSLTRFKGPTYFSGCVFEREARFGGAQFENSAVFLNAIFESCARFYGASLRYAVFELAIFKGLALFEGTIFNFFATFLRARFEGGPALFLGVNSQAVISFDKTYFEKVPDFSQAIFAAAPRLDDITIGHRAEAQTFWRSFFQSDAPPDIEDYRTTAGVIARYRALRRLAVLGHDHDSEAWAFKGETRAKRGTEHKWHHAAFWYGVAYDALSDFGRSLSRPLAVWFASVIVFATIYFTNAGVRAAEWFQPCSGNDVPKALRAFIFSTANALPFIGSNCAEEARAFYTCVGVPLEQVSAWSPIIQMGQTLWSTVLIFLFLLAVRNQFRIK